MLFRTQYTKIVFSLFIVAFNTQTYAETLTPENLEFCSVCHGSNLMGNENILAPRLSDLPAWYVERQLKSFREGWRGNNSVEEDTPGLEMRHMALELSDEEISAISTWVEATESSPPETTITSADIDAGKSLYATCAACHGAQGEGNVALNSPPLSGLNDWYLVKQLNNFQDGLRGSHADDIYGMQMKATMAIIKSDQDIINVASYINQLNLLKE